MNIVALNVFQILNLFDMVGKENKELIGWMEELEKEALLTEDKQQRVERKLDQLIKELA